MTIKKRIVWHVGQGWKKIVWTENGTPEGWADYRHGEESSEGCILLVVKKLCESRNLSLKELYGKAHPLAGETDFDNLEQEYAQYTKIPTKFDEHTVAMLLEDLTDVNYHGLRGVLEEALKN